jgi:hypothetical protein
MKNYTDTNTQNDPKGFKKYLFKRIFLISAATLIGLWGFVMVLNRFQPASTPASKSALHEETKALHDAETQLPVHPTTPLPAAGTRQPMGDLSVETAKPPETVPVSPEKQENSAEMPAAPAHPAVPAAATADKTPKRTGVAFISAAIEPLAYELNKRWWGWRPNDILNFTDNINNFQLGVLEATRRTSVILAERISRTGATASFDPNLERAMNWFMINADRYWFPSAESKYKEGLRELAAYKDRLLNGKAQFYTRTDNLIPLLNAYVDLLGSCEENLVKQTEEDGEPIGYFKADDYFFYARGVAHTLLLLLEALESDFADTVGSRRGSELLHHAVEACRRAVEIDPILITNSRLGGILANHRANMAAPISHARFYLEVLAKTLST